MCPDAWCALLNFPRAMRKFFLNYLYSVLVNHLLVKDMTEADVMIVKGTVIKVSTENYRQTIRALD